MRSVEPISGPTSLDAVAEAVAEIEGRETLAPAERKWVPTGWPEIDGCVGGGLRLGVVHEWFSEGRERRRDCAPVSLLSHLALRVSRGHASGGRVLWIGRGCWPSVASLLPNPDLLERSIFIDASPSMERVWAADLGLRSGGAALVVADGSGLSMADSRRLQLAAGVGGVPCLLARPAREVGEISAAWTRWRVAPTPSPNESPRWIVELLRCKGLRPSSEAARRWVVQREHEAGIVSLAPDVSDRSAPAIRPAVRHTA